MAAADVVVTGTVLTVDESRPTAEALAVADGRIVAVGDRSEVGELIGSDTQTIDLDDGCVMPGFVEAHGHPLMEAIALSDRLVDIRPVTLRDADDVVGAVRREVARRGSDGAYLNGWDPLLQPGLPEPTQAWLDEMAPDGPLVIIHNSGHKAYFNSHAARRSGLTRDTPDPKGAKFGRDASGEHRTAPSGRVLAPDERLTVEQAIRAQTIDAAWQLFADDIVGSLGIGKYADMVVLSADPRTVPPECIADLEVRATFLAGRQVYAQ